MTPSTSFLVGVKPFSDRLSSSSLSTSAGVKRFVYGLVAAEVPASFCARGGRSVKVRPRPSAPWASTLGGAGARARGRVDSRGAAASSGSEAGGLEVAGGARGGLTRVGRAAPEGVGARSVCGVVAQEQQELQRLLVEEVRGEVPAKQEEVGVRQGDGLGREKEAAALTLASPAARAGPAAKGDPTSPSENPSGRTGARPKGQAGVRPEGEAEARPRGQVKVSRGGEAAVAIQTPLCVRECTLERRVRGSGERPAAAASGPPAFLGRVGERCTGREGGRCIEGEGMGRGGAHPQGGPPG